MSRPAIINPHVLLEGFTAGGARFINKWEEKSQSISSWTFFYHKPYANDWAEARKKARERKFK